jgi:hypothetical protein
MALMSSPEPMPVEVIRELGAPVELEALPVVGDTAELIECF